MSKIITVGSIWQRMYFRRMEMKCQGARCCARSCGGIRFWAFSASLRAVLCHGGLWWRAFLGPGNRQRGHDVRLIPPAYVKPFVKRHKNDAADAEAICEAVQRPNPHYS